jgi:hypothetical protein
MKVIANIPEDMLQELKDGCFGAKHALYDLVGAICNGVVLPDNATNGNIFCLFNKVSRVFELRDCVEVEVEVRPNIIWTSQFDKEWWNTKWEGGQEDGKA